MHKKRLLPIFILLSGTTVIVPLTLTSCSRGGINIANFESYMSKDVIHDLKRDYEIKNSLNFLYYATNEDIETKFKKYYDIAIPSTYEVISLFEKDQLEPIDWQEFNLKKIENGSVINEQIENSEDAMSLFSPTAQAVLQEATDWIIENVPLRPAWFHNILDCGVPYFLQDWIFAYKYTSIGGLGDSSSFNDILNVTSPRSSGFNSFFTPNKTKRIGMIEDTRSVFDMCKLIDTEDSDTKTINPTTEKSINDFRNTYSSLTSKYNNGYFWLNSDSGQMNISLATPLSDGGLNSTFTYNGDVLYAAMGSDLNAGIDPSNAKYIQYFDDDDPNHRQLHVVIPPSVPTMMDMMVINKKSATTSKRDDLYKIVKKVCLDSANVEDNEFDQTYSFNNFEYILYTDPLFLTDKYIREEYFSEDNFANYELLKKIYTIGNNALIENPISDIDKSNMYWAFIMERERI